MSDHDISQDGCTCFDPVVSLQAKGPNLVHVSTRMLIVLALICGMAILVAFAVQAAQLI
jgi:hypothetical protein